MPRLLATACFALWFAACAIASAQQKPTDSEPTVEKKEPEGKDKKSEPSDSFVVSTVVTTGTVLLDGDDIQYEVHSGTISQADDSGEEKARMFFVAYTRPNQDQSRRPVTFAYNGGPGSSSVWLHLGMLGPERIEFPLDATPLRPPYQLSSNPHSMLDVTDLVFIDPVSTGFSRPTEDEPKSQFHGYNEDVRSVGQFIHDWTSHFERWESPKFLLGESYGGLRTAGLAQHLQLRTNKGLDGATNKGLDGASLAE